MLDSINQCIYILDAEGNFIYVNSAFVKYTETPKDILLHRNVKSIQHTFSPCISEKVHQCKAPVTMFQDIITRSKKSHRQLVTASPIFDAQGHIKYIVVTVNSLADINERFQQATANEVSRYIESLDTFSFVDGRRTIVSASKQMKKLAEPVEEIGGH
jgi:PAS domain-containing protein